jgi:hypothetical protein
MLYTYIYIYFTRLKGFHDLSSSSEVSSSHKQNQQNNNFSDLNDLSIFYVDIRTIYHCSSSLLKNRRENLRKHIRHYLF